MMERRYDWREGRKEGENVWVSWVLCKRSSPTASNPPLTPFPPSPPDTPASPSHCHITIIAGEVTLQTALEATSRTFLAR